MTNTVTTGAFLLLAWEGNPVVHGSDTFTAIAALDCLVEQPKLHLARVFDAFTTSS